MAGYLFHLKAFPFLPALIVLVATFGVADLASAQPLRKLLGEEQAETLPRLPDDQIEGTIWEYKSVKYRSKVEEGEEEPKISGRFRIEGSAVFAADNKITIKPREEGKAMLKKLITGEGAELSVPSGPEKKRIGEYKKLSNGKIKFTFDDPESLHGILIIKQKKDSPSVWQGDYAEKDGNKTTRKWLVELRAIED